MPRYAQSTASKHHALEDALNKAKARSKHWEWKAKEGIERIIGAEKERDEAKKEAQIARLATVVVSDAKVQAEDKMARVQDALAIVEEARLRLRLKFPT